MIDLSLNFSLACLVSRESELAFLLRSLIKRSPPPPTICGEASFAEPYTAREGALNHMTRALLHRKHHKHHLLTAVVGAQGAEAFPAREKQVTAVRTSHFSFLKLP